jgi:hypothetical protein
MSDKKDKYAKGSDPMNTEDRSQHHPKCPVWIGKGPLRRQHELGQCRDASGKPLERRKGERRKEQRRKVAQPWSCGHDDCYCVVRLHDGARYSIDRRQPHSERRDNLMTRKGE